MPDEEEVTISANATALIEAGRQLAIMKKLVTVFEAGIITNIEDLNLELSEAQIATLIDNFMTAKAALIAEINKVSG